MAAKVILLKPNGNTYGYDVIQDAIIDSVAGDCVVVYNNTYTSSIELKNGVNMYMLPGTVISSSEIAGTIRDAGNQVDVIMDGRVKLYNSNGSQYEVVLTNSNSTLDRYNSFSNLNITGSLFGTASYAESSGQIDTFWSESNNGMISRNSNVSVTGSLNIKGVQTSSLAIRANIFNSEPELLLKIDDNPNDYGWKFRVRTPGPTSSFSLNISSDNGNAEKDAITILNSTNYVGLGGITNPKVMLDVSGSVYITGSLNVSGSNNIRPYKVYTALLTQLDTNAPVATVLENTIGNITWGYLSVGIYTATLTGAFTSEKSIGFVSPNFMPELSDGTFKAKLKRTSNDVMTLYTTYLLNDAPVNYDTAINNALGDGCFIEIRVYS